MAAPTRAERVRAYLLSKIQGGQPQGAASPPITAPPVEESPVEESPVEDTRPPLDLAGPPLAKEEEKYDAFSSISDPRVQKYMRDKMETRNKAVEEAAANKRNVDLWTAPFKAIGLATTGERSLGAFDSAVAPAYARAGAPLTELEAREKAEQGLIEQQGKTSDVSTKLGEAETAAGAKKALEDKNSVESQWARRVALELGSRFPGLKITEQMLEGRSAAEIMRFPGIGEMVKEAFKTQKPVVPTRKSRQDGRKKITEEWNPTTGKWDKISEGDIDTAPRTTRTIPEQDRFLKDTNTFVKKIDNAVGIIEGAQEIARTAGSVGDVARLYGVIKGIDWESVVREGEIGLFQQGQSLASFMEKLQERYEGRAGALLSTVERQNLDKAVSTLGRNLTTYRSDYLASQKVQWEAGGGKPEQWDKWQSTRYSRGGSVDPQTKTVGGKKYRKVEGGWEEIQ